MNNTSQPAPALRDHIREALEQLRQVLPMQPPLWHFTHQNPLQNYQSLPFEQALTKLKALNGGSSYLTEATFRELYQQGHITDADIIGALQQTPDLHTNTILLQTQPPIAKADVYRMAMLFDLEPVLPSQLAWQIEELNTLEKFQPDVPLAVRQRLLDNKASVSAETKLISDLWQLLLNKLDLEQNYLHPENMLDLSLDQAEALLAQYRASQKKVSLKKATMRERMQETAAKHFAGELQRLGKDISFRQLLLDLCGVDILDYVRPQMIRLCSSGLDEGLAAWQLPNRNTVGLYAAWRAVASLDINPLLQELPNFHRLITQLPENPEDAIILQLTDLQIPQSQWNGYLQCLVLEMPGWSGLINWREQHPEYTPVNDTKPTLADYLAIRLTLDRLWLNRICRDAWQIEASLGSLQVYFRKNASEYLVRWHLYRGDLPEYLIQQAETMILNAGQDQYDRREWQNLADIIWTWQGSNMMNSRPAYSVYDTAWPLFRLSQHLGLSAAHLQAVSKTDLEKTLETLAEFTAARRSHVWLLAHERHCRQGLLDRFYSQHRQAHAYQNNIRPTAQLIFSMDNRVEHIRHYLEAAEINIETFGVANFLTDITSKTAQSPVSHSRIFKLKQALKQVWHHTLRQNVLLSPLLTLISLPIILGGLLTKAFFPRRHAELTARFYRYFEPSNPALPTFNQSDVSTIALQLAEWLQTIGFNHNFSDWIVLVGFAPDIRNNSDLVACHLAANARTAEMAALANRSEVRSQLAELGIVIPSSTWFISAEYDSRHEAIIWLECETLPVEVQPALTKLKACCVLACQQSAQARAPTTTRQSAKKNPQKQLTYVNNFPTFSSALDHIVATSAIIGRRALSKGVNFNNRAFLASYDPIPDTTGQHLEKLLQTLVPSLSASHLNHYFATVNNQMFGSGNGVLHNVIGQLGMMQGVSADLRNGLPVQMTDRSATIRLQLVVETSKANIEHLFKRQTALQQLIKHGWVQLILIEPQTGDIFILNETQNFVLWQPELMEHNTSLRPITRAIPSNEAG